MAENIPNFPPELVKKLKKVARDKRCLKPALTPEIEIDQKQDYLAYVAQVSEEHIMSLLAKNYKENTSEFAMEDLIRKEFSQWLKAHKDELVQEF